jgi:hypothetical protein
MIRTPLRAYQNEAVQRALPHDGFALIPEQRTGKCLISLRIIDERKPDILLIICPNKAIAVWWSQIEQHLDLDWKCKIQVVNFEACSRTKQSRAHYRRQAREWVSDKRTVFIVCDEAQRIKRRGSFQARLVRSLGHLATWRLALTGTPIAQGVQDVWSIFDFIQPGVLFHTWEDFQERFLEYGGYQNRKVVGYNHREEFDAIFHAYSYRVTFVEARRSVGLKAPRIRQSKVLFDLAPSTRQHYNELEQELETVVQDIHVSTPLVLTLAMKLQQLAAGFLIHTEKIPGKRKGKRTIIHVGTEKMHWLSRTLVRIGDQKVVICARFIHEIDAISVILEQLGKSHKRIAGGHEFDGEFDVDIILLQIQSGIAFDLSEAHIYIFFSWDYSYINYEQAKFRVLSFATEQVDYYFLIAKGTVDEVLFEAVSKKKDFATMIVDRYRRGYREHHQATRGNTGRAK